MTRYRGPRVKICRSLGVELPGLTRKKITRNTPPGMHGATKKTKSSDYKIRLKEKQKLRYHFGILEGQLKIYMTEAVRRKGPTGNNLITLLESRLDNIVWRLGFAPTIPAARQMVVHGHILVNGKRVDRPSYQVKVNSDIAICDKIRKKDWVIARLAEGTSRSIPGYLQNDLAEASGKVIQAPLVTDLPLDVDLQQVVEFYSQML